MLIRNREVVQSPSVQVFKTRKSWATSLYLTAHKKVPSNLNCPISPSSLEVHYLLLTLSTYSLSLDIIYFFHKPVISLILVLVCQTVGTSFCVSNIHSWALAMICTFLLCWFAHTSQILIPSGGCGRGENHHHLSKVKTTLWDNLASFKRKLLHN